MSFPRFLGSLRFEHFMYPSRQPVLTEIALLYFNIRDLKVQSLKQKSFNLLFSHTFTLQCKLLMMHNWEVFTLLLQSWQQTKGAEWPNTVRKMHHAKGSWIKLFKLPNGSKFPPLKSLKSIRIQWHLKQADRKQGKQGHLLEDHPYWKSEVFSLRSVSQSQRALQPTQLSKNIQENPDIYHFPACQMDLQGAVSINGFTQGMCNIEGILLKWFSRQLHTQRKSQ